MTRRTGGGRFLERGHALDGVNHISLSEQGMVSKRILKPILENESVTRGLADPEAKILIEWLVAQTEKISARESCLNRVAQEVDRLCRKARALSRFVFLWGNPRSRAAACQLAATERFSWPLPDRSIDPCELMLDILSYETG